MKQEVSRKVVGDKIIVSYDDGSQEELALEQTPPQNVNVDADSDKVEQGGHTFSEETLKERGHQ